MELTELLKRSSSQHSHLCPRQVLGVRMGLAGLAVVGLQAPMPHKAAFIFIESDGCFSTGIEVSTGAAVGHRTLRVMDLGKVAATFANVETGCSIRLAAHPDVRKRALKYAPGIKQRYYAQLKGYQLMPDAELFTFQEVKLTPSLEVVMSRPGLRVNCSRCGEEISNERQFHRDGKILCRTCAGDAYYLSK